MFDSFWRAEDPDTLRTVVGSAPFRNVIGDVRDPDGPGFIQIPGSVDWVYFPPNRVVITPATYDGNGNIITPAVTDPWCWVQLRLYGDAEVADDDVADWSVARFDRSRIRKWMQENGTFAYLDEDPAWSGIPGAHVRGFVYTRVNGKRIAILRGSEMQAAGPPVHFHEYYGGNFTE